MALITFACAVCNRFLEVPLDMAGKLVVCSICHNTVEVPSRVPPQSLPSSGSGQPPVWRSPPAATVAPPPPRSSPILSATPLSYMDKRTLALIAGLFLLSSLSGSFLVAKICVRSGSGADSSHSLAIVAIKDQMDRELPALAASVQALRSDVAQVKTNTVVLGYVLGAVGDALFGDASVRDICAKGRSLHRTPPDETNHLLRVLETYSRGRVSDADIFWNAFLAGVSVVEQPSSRAVNVNSAPVSVADETTRQIRDIYAAIWGSGVHSYSSLYSVEPMKKQLDEISNALRRR